MNINWKKNLTLFLIGQSLSMFGSMLVHYAVLWHVTRETLSGSAITLFSIAFVLPTCFIAPFAGVWADRYNRKHMINLADASIAAVTLIMSVLFTLGIDYIGLLLICAVARSFGQGVQSPAVSALVPQLVPKENLTRVNGISSSLQSLTMLAAPAASGALLSFAPIQVLLYIDVITAAAGIAILYFFVKVPERSAREEATIPAAGHFHDMGEGLRYIFSHAFIVIFLIFGSIFQIMIAPAAMLTPLQTMRNFGNDVWRLTAIEIAFSIGMMLGGLIIGTWGGFKNKSHTLTVSIALFGIITVFFGILGNFWIYLGFMVLAGMTIPLFNAPMMAILQAKINPDFMGRVFSVLTMMSSVMMPVGMVIFGPLSDLVSVDLLMIISGAFIILLAFIFILIKNLREAGMPVSEAENTGEDQTWIEE